MLEVVISLLIAAIILIAIFYIISIWIYKRAPSNMGFIRTGFLGTKVCLGRGAIVLPVFHEITWVSLETIKFAVSRAREQAILTADNIRIDVNTELYAHVGHTEHAVLNASRTLGEKTFDAEKVRNLLEAKVVGAMRSFAATKTLRAIAREPRRLCQGNQGERQRKLHRQRLDAGRSDHRRAGTVDQRVFPVRQRVRRRRPQGDHRDHLGSAAQGSHHRKADHGRDPQQGPDDATRIAGNRAPGSRRARQPGQGSRQRASQAAAREADLRARSAPGGGAARAGKRKGARAAANRARHRLHGRGEAPRNRAGAEGTGAGAGTPRPRDRADRQGA